MSVETVYEECGEWDGFYVGMTGTEFMKHSQIVNEKGCATFAIEDDRSKVYYTFTDGLLTSIDVPEELYTAPNA